MDESLNQPSRVQEEGALPCKLLLNGTKDTFANVVDGTIRISTG